MFFEDRQKTGIVHRQQRAAFQTTEKAPEPDSADTDRRQDGRPVQAKTVRMKRRRHKPEQLDEMHHGDRSRHGCESARLAFDGSRQ